MDAAAPGLVVPWNHRSVACTCVSLRVGVLAVNRLESVPLPKGPSFCVLRLPETPTRILLGQMPRLVHGQECIIANGQ